MKSILVRIYYKISADLAGNQTHPAVGRGCKRPVGVPAGTELPWECRNPAPQGSLGSGRREIRMQWHHSGVCKSPGLSVQYLDSLTFMNCSSEFLFCFSYFF